MLNNVRKGQNSMIENKKAKELVKVYCDKCGDYLITDYTNSLHYCLLCNQWSKAKGDDDNGSKESNY